MVFFVWNVAKSHTVSSEIKQSWEVTDLARAMSGIGQLSVGIPEFVEEWMHHGVNGSLSLSGCILEKSRDEINGVGVSLAENLAEGVRLDLRELVLHVVGVHGTDLLSCGSSKDLDDFDKLINT